MLLELTSQLDVVEVVEAVYRIAQGLVVFFLDEQGVVCLVDGLDIELRGVSETTRKRANLHIRVAQQ